MTAPFDVAIIGGGVNGTGTARDCAMRGMRTVLVEKGDFSSGTSWASSGMIHGGIRYLQYDREVTRSSCIDSGYIQRIAPHLIFRIPFLYSVLPGDRYSLDLMEVALEAYDRYQPLKGGKPHTRLSTKEALTIEPGLNPDIRGALTFDEWGIDVPRLCFLNALSAIEHGAEVRNHTEVIGFLWDAEAVAGLRVRDLRSGKEESIEARVVLNVAGPWADRVAQMAGCRVPLRLGKGIHIVFDRRISSVAITAEAIDGRGIFVMPHENWSLIGTTDDDYYGDPDRQRVTRDEVEYLLEGVARTFPGVRRHRMIRVTSALRPTLYAWGRYEDALSRRHEVFDHAVTDGVEGMLSMAGGKLASYREMSEHAANGIARKIGNSSPSRTHLEPLPGGDGQVDVEALAESTGLPGFAVCRAAYRHGSRAAAVLAPITEKPEEGEEVCVCEPVTRAEVRHAIRNEQASTIGDLFFRTRLAAGPCQGMGCALRAAEILADELGIDALAAHRLLRGFLERQWQNRSPVLEGDQVVQEELLRATFFLALGIGWAVQGESL